MRGSWPRSVHPNVGEGEEVDAEVREREEAEAKAVGSRARRPRQEVKEQLQGPCLSKAAPTSAFWPFAQSPQKVRKAV